MLDAFLAYFSFGERASGLANLLQIVGALVALLSYSYGLVRYERRRQRQYQHRLEELLAEQAGENERLASRAADLEAETPAGWLKLADAEADEVQAHRTVEAALADSTPSLVAAFLRLAGFHAALALTQEGTASLDAARRYAKLAAALDPNSSRAAAFLEQLDSIASQLQMRAGKRPVTSADASDLALEWAGPIADTSDLVKHLTALASENISASLDFVAERLAWRARAIAKVRLPPDDWLSMSARYHWAKALVGCTQPAEAVEELNSLVPIMSSALGASDEATLAARALRAYALNQNFRTEEALSEILQIAPLRRATSGEDDPGTLSTRHTLSVVLSAAGRLEDAKRELESLVADEARVKGKDDADTLMSRQVYACVLSRLKHDLDAAEQFKIALSGLRRAYGRTGMPTLETRVHFAIHHLHMGRLNEGLRELERVLPELRARAGGDHPLTSKVKEIIAATKGSGYQVGSTWAIFGNGKVDRRGR